MFESNVEGIGGGYELPNVEGSGSGGYELKSSSRSMLKREAKRSSLEELASAASTPGLIPWCADGRGLESMDCGLLANELKPESVSFAELASLATRRFPSLRRLSTSFSKSWSWSATAGDVLNPGFVRQNPCRSGHHGKDSIMAPTQPLVW